MVFKSEQWLVTMGILMLLAACVSEPDASPSESAPVEVRDPAPSDGSLKTDKESYAASCEGEGNYRMCTFTLELIYTNQTDEAISFDHCYPEDTTPIYGVGALTEDESAFNPGWACVGFDERTVKVEAVQQRIDRLELSGPNAWDGVTHEPYGLLEGRLQIFYEAYSCASTDISSDLYACKLPREQATSNVFTVTLPD